MDTVIQYRSADLIAHSPITAQNVKTGMSLRGLCDAAVRYSDNAAANLLYAHLGGPAQLQAFMRGMGDSVTNMNRTEPDLSFAVPGDARDTTSPQAWGNDLKNLVIGEALPEAQRSTIVDWLQHNTTGATLIRAALPTEWAVADKTGSGWYGTRNDIAVVWPQGRKPWVLAIMSSRAERSATIDDELLAQAARVVRQAFH
jgi:beta-lactamase class A